MKVASIFPYQIKNRELFYNRNHDAVPLLERDKYWDQQIRNVIEGRWINDEGTWIHMMPKLDWQINIFVGSVVTTKFNTKKVSFLTLTDREWIIFTYLLCCYGFSGYSEDEFFTSNLVVDYVERNVELDFFQRQQIDSNPNIYDKHGKMKKYVRAWDYLTEHYLVKEPQGKPLGKILYENDMMDATIMGARNSTKTMAVAGGHVCHEYFTGGVRDWEYIGDLGVNNNRFGIGSVDSKKVRGFSDVILDFYKNMPGKYNKDGIILPSPLYRRLVGAWGEGEVKHQYTDSITKEIKGSGSTLEFGVYQNAALFVGGRRFTIIREEFGLIDDIVTVIGAEAETLKNKTEGVKLGIAVNLGTSGFLKKIEGPKTVFYNPARFGCYGIPNYWEKPDSLIGLFMPDYYVDSRYKDKNGNTIIQDAYNASVARVKLLEENHASGQEIRDHELNNPNWPSQMFLDAQSGKLCSDLARIRRVRLLEQGCPRTVGDFSYDEKGKVIFTANPRGTVIDNYSSQTTKQPKKNSWVIYEMPIKGAQKGLYRITYDTIRSDGDGKTDDASMASIIVRKLFDLSKKGKQNTVVARYTGRPGSKDKTHEQAIFAAEFYNALVLHEDDVGDFPSYCRTKKKARFMAPTPYLGSSMKISGNAIFNVGIKMGDNAELKDYGLTALNEFLTTEIGYDDDNGGLPVRNIDNIDDLLILDEIANYGEGNFDNISAMILHAIWDRADAGTVFDPGDIDQQKKKSNNAREMYEMAMRNLGYSQAYMPKIYQNATN